MKPLAALTQNGLHTSSPYIEDSETELLPKPTPCSVCSEMGSLHSAEEPLKTCGNCGVVVHGSCCGEAPDKEHRNDSWICRKCRSGAAKEACLLCPMKSGIFTSVASGGWAHVICSLYIPEVIYEKPATMEGVITPKYSQRTCSICDKRGIGCCRRCDDDDCDVYFHATCAQALGLLVFDHQPDGRIKFSAFCHSHRSLYVACENIKWIRENFSCLNIEEVLVFSSAPRKIVKKIIYRLAKSLAKTCPYQGPKGPQVNGWFVAGCDRFFERHPKLGVPGVSKFIRNYGLGFYHGCLKRKFNAKHEVKEAVIDSKTKIPTVKLY